MMKQINLNQDEILALRKKHLGDSCTIFYPHEPLLIMRAKKSYMYNEKDQEYLDCINNVASVGHCHPKVVEAAHNQNQLLETNSRYLHPNIVLLAQKLTQLLPEPLEKCYFLNSGSEATDLALNLAFYFTQGTEVIVLDHAYHGHLMSAMAVSPYKFEQGKGILGKQDWVHVAPCPDTYRGLYNKDNIHKLELNGFKNGFKNVVSPEDFDFGAAYAYEVVKLIKKIKESGKKLAAFIAESMVSCGGQIILPSNYLKYVYEEVRKAGGICIADEIQAGYGRCGDHWWAFQLQDVVPDMVTIGKSMGNGHPVAALITTPAISAKYAENGIQYFNTYGGNPVSCAVALSVIRVIEEENLIENSKNIGKYLLEKLRNLQNKFPNVIGDVRGIGLFIGIELVKDRISKEPDANLADDIIYKMKDRYIVISREGPFENILKFKPPLCFSKGDADRLLTALKEILEKMKIS